MQPVPYADLNGDNYVDFADYTIVCRVVKGDLWVTRYKWFCENVYADGSTALVKGWTYTVWEDRPKRNDSHPNEQGFDWIDPYGNAPILRMNYVFFERMFPELFVDDPNEPLYVESFTQAGPAPTVVGWEIASTHGSDLGEVWCPIEDGYVEPRTNGVTKLCVRFDQPMDTNKTDPNAIAIFGETNAAQPHTCSVSWDGCYSMIITLCSALPDRDSYRITIDSSIESATGRRLGVVHDICITALKADANTSYAVNAQDLLAINAHVGESVNCENARFDINGSGEINAQDLLAARAYAGHVAPQCPP